MDSAPPTPPPDPYKTPSRLGSRQAIPSTPYTPHITPPSSTTTTPAHPTSHSSAATLLGLPPPVLSRILALSLTTTASPLAQQSAAHTLALVCRTFYFCPALTSLLVVKDVHALDRLGKSLRGPNRARAESGGVKELRLVGPFWGIEPHWRIRLGKVLKRLEGLEGLRVGAGEGHLLGEEGEGLEEALEESAALREVDLHGNFTRMSVHTFDRLLGSWPNLHRLSLTSSTFQPPAKPCAPQSNYGSPQDSNRHTSARLARDPAALPPLESLTVSLNSPLALHVLTRVLNNPPTTLRHLKVTCIAFSLFASPTTSTAGQRSASSSFAFHTPQSTRSVPHTPRPGSARSTFPGSLVSLTLLLDRWTTVELPLPAPIPSLERVTISQEMLRGLRREELEGWLGEMSGLKELRVVRSDGWDSRRGWIVGGVTKLVKQ